MEETDKSHKTHRPLSVLQVPVHKIKEPGIVEKKDDQHRGDPKPINVIAALLQWFTPLEGPLLKEAELASTPESKEFLPVPSAMGLGVAGDDPPLIEDGYLRIEPERPQKCAYEEDHRCQNKRSGP